MERSKRGRLIAGLLLILLGAWFLAVQLFPPLGALFQLEYAWPLIVVGVGIFLLILGLVLGAPGMAVPASIVGGIGALLYWQNATGRWDSWAYAWTLLPGFVGIGILLSVLLGEQDRRGVTGALWLLAISVVLFLIFGSILGGLSLFGPYWPVLLILLGLGLLFASFFRSRAY